MSTHIIIPDAHATPKTSNKRALWVSRLIAEVKPDVVIDLGDSADMSSLSSYDKGKRAFQGRSYNEDVVAYRDFQDKVWHYPRKSKRKMPRRVRLIGNHEQRIDRALDQSPELEGTIGYEDLDLGSYYDDVVHYSGGTPGVITIDGVEYAHYFVSGVMGRSISGEHPGHSLNVKRHVSSTCGHTHLFSHDTRPIGGRGGRINGLHAGCFTDHNHGWAGESQRYWYPCVIIKNNVENGNYDLSVISLSSLEKAYASEDDK